MICKIPFSEVSCWEPPYEGFNLEIFLVSGFLWLIARFRGFIFSGFPFGNSPFSEFQFRDFRLFGFSIRRSSPFRGFNSGISAFSGFQFGDPRLFGVSIRGFPLFRGFDSGIFAFSGFISGIFAFRFGDPHSEGFFLSVLGVLHTFRLLSGFFRAGGSISGVFFRRLALFRGFFSGNQVHFGQVDPFRGFSSGKWVHFGASFRAIGSISVVFGGHRVLFGYFVGAIGSSFFFFVFSNHWFHLGVFVRAMCAPFGDVSCNWVQLGEHFGSCSNNSVQSSFLPQQFLKKNPKNRNFRRRFPEDHGRLRPPSLSIPCLGNGFDFVFANFGSGPREWLLSQSSSPTPSWASVSTSLRGFPSPSPEGPQNLEDISRDFLGAAKSLVSQQAVWDTPRNLRKKCVTKSVQKIRKNPCKTLCAKNRYKT